MHKTKNHIETFEKVYLLPIHFKISENKYQLYIEILKKVSRDKLMGKAFWCYKYIFEDISENKNNV